MVLAMGRDMMRTCGERINAGQGTAAECRVAELLAQFEKKHASSSLTAPAAEQAARLLAEGDAAARARVAKAMAQEE